MKAIVYKKYGSYKNLRLEEVEKPVPGFKEVLVKVNAVSLNSSDVEFLTARPRYIRMWGPIKPKFEILGSDIAGIVEAIGPGNSNFSIGDAVFGDLLGRFGGLAEYVVVPEKLILKKPDFLSFEGAAALPQASLVALQGLKNKGKIAKDENVLINGAGGSAGSFAIQLAKMEGCKVTAVDKNSKFEVMRSLGADYVIDYLNEDFTQNGQKYDLILDFVATRSIIKIVKSLKNNGRYVMVGGSIPKLLQTLTIGSLISLFSKKSLGVLGARPNENMDVITELLKSGKLKINIDRKYKLHEVPEAFKYLAEGRAKGKILVSIK